jgi:hypothetical protein
MSKSSTQHTAFTQAIAARAMADAHLGPDPIELMARADRADWTLLRLVLSAAMATFVLALASSLPV